MNCFSKIPEYLLSNSPDGYTIPALGFGLAAMEPELLERSVLAAVETGYRFFDCAPEYGNEEEVGRAIKRAKVSREKLFISTKLEGRDHAYEKCKQACDYSLKKLRLDYLDCYLIHWPMPDQGLYCEAWRAMEDMYFAGKVKVIGLSNFTKEHIDKILGMCRVRPMINELEINPYFIQDELRTYCQGLGIHIVNWFPLGGPRKPLHPYPVSDYKILMEDPTVKEIGKKYGKTIGQTVLRWAVQHQCTPIPKSSKPERIAENSNIFDFQLTSNEMKQIDLLNHNRRLGPDPSLFNEFIDLTSY